MNFELSICDTFGFGEPGVMHERGKTLFAQVMEHARAGMLSPTMVSLIGALCSGRALDLKEALIKWQIVILAKAGI